MFIVADLVSLTHNINKFMITYILRYFSQGNWTTGIEKQWSKTDIVSRTDQHMSIPALGHVYQHPFKPYRQAGH